MMQFAVCDWGPGWLFILIICAVYAVPFAFSIVVWGVLRRSGPELAFLIGLTTFGLGLVLVCMEFFDWLNSVIRVQYFRSAIYYYLYAGALALLGLWEMQSVYRNRTKTRDDDLDASD